MKSESRRDAGPCKVMYDIICQEFIRNEHRPLTVSQLQLRIKSTPELMPLVGGNTDEVIQLLSRLGKIAYIQPPEYKERVIIPIDGDSAFG